MGSSSAKRLPDGICIAAEKREGIPRVMRFLKSGGTINSKTKHGRTLLHSAAYGGNVELIEPLLKAGANIDAKNDEGLTPLMLAVMHDQPNVVRLLVNHGADFDTVMEMHTRTALELAREAGKAEMVYIMKQSQPLSGSSTSASNTTSPKVEFQHGNVFS